MRRTTFLAAGALLVASCGGSGKGGGHPDGGAGALWVGVIGTGQSLSVGAASNGLVFTTPSPNSLKLSLGALEMAWPIGAEDPAAVGGAAGRADSHDQHDHLQRPVPDQHLR